MNDNVIGGFSASKGLLSFPLIIDVLGIDDSWNHMRADHDF
jgi:hypothetical protein